MSHSPFKFLLPALFAGSVFSQPTHGKVEPYRHFLQAPTSATVKDVSVAAGSDIHKGQQLLLLDSPELALRIAGVTARSMAADQARRDAEDRLRSAEISAANQRAQINPNPALTSQMQVMVDSARASADGANAVWHTTEAELRSLIQQQSQMRALAPFNGSVVNVFVKPGDPVKYATRLLELDDPTRRRVTVIVATADNAHTLDRATVRRSGELYEAYMERIESNTGGRRVTFVVTDKTRSLTNGAEVEILLRDADK